MVVLTYSGPYPPFGQQAIQLCTDLIQLGLRHSILSVVFDWLRWVSEFYFVFDGSVGWYALWFCEYVLVFIAQFVPTCCSVCVMFVFGFPLCR